MPSKTTPPRTGTPKVDTFFRLPAPLYERLKLRSSTSERPMVAIAVDAISQFLAMEENLGAKAK